MRNEINNSAASSTGTSTGTDSLRGKEVHNIDKAIKHHVRSIQRRLKRLAKIDQHAERKLESIAEPVTFCDRVRVVDRFAKKETKQVKKIERHLTKVQKLNHKLTVGGATVDLPEKAVELLQRADALVQDKAELVSELV